MIKQSTGHAETIWHILTHFDTFWHMHSHIFSHWPATNLLPSPKILEMSDRLCTEAPANLEQMPQFLAIRRSILGWERERELAMTRVIKSSKVITYLVASRLVCFNVAVFFAMDGLHRSSSWSREASKAHSFTCSPPWKHSQWYFSRQLRFDKMLVDQCLTESLKVGLH